jgi:hypothetical protein
MMPHTVAGKSTTARVMSEPRSLMKGSGRRKDNWESGKYMGEIEIFVMYDYGSLAQRVNERENSKRLNVYLCDENFGK